MRTGALARQAAGWWLCCALCGSGAHALAGARGLQQFLSADTAAVQQLLAADSVAAWTRATLKVFTYWNYPEGASPFVYLNLKTWQRHLPRGTKVLFVNDTNFRELVPDAPEEWSKLPTHASKSDAVRAAVLYHHGGLYMDTDFLLMKPLDEYLKPLEDGWDIVAYADELGQKTSGPCDRRKSFSSNFMAARQGNDFSRTWWENIKMKLTRLCGELESQLNKVCCHEAFNERRFKRTCKIPWAYLEHLKQPECDYDVNHTYRPGYCARPIPAHPKKKPLGPDDPLRQTPEALSILAEVKRGNALAKPFPVTTKLYCLAGDESLAPHLNGEVYWQPWSSASQATEPNQTVNAWDYDLRFSCREAERGGLACERGNWGAKPRNYSRFFDRFAYHLFFTMRGSGDVKHSNDILKKGWLLSELYRRSLGPHDT